MIERVGLTPEIRDMGSCDQVEFWLQRLDQCDPAQLETLVRASLNTETTDARR